MTDTNIVVVAREYGTRSHAETNHMYAGRPYAFHLAMVAVIANTHILGGVFKSREDEEVAAAAAWVHDVIEDARQTYNDVVAALSKSDASPDVVRRVADVAFLLTNDKGRTRDERASSRYYDAIADDPVARFVKLCDRAANTAWSVYSGGKMLDRYVSEWAKVKAYLHTPEVAGLTSWVDDVLTGRLKPDMVVAAAESLTSKLDRSYPPLGWPRMTSDDVWSYMCDQAQLDRPLSVEKLLERFEGAIDPEDYREAGCNPLDPESRRKYFEACLKTYERE